MSKYRLLDAGIILLHNFLAFFFDFFQGNRIKIFRN